MVTAISWTKEEQVEGVKVQDDAHGRHSWLERVRDNPLIVTMSCDCDY